VFVLSVCNFAGNGRTDTSGTHRAGRKSVTSRGSTSHCSQSQSCQGAQLL